MDRYARGIQECLSAVEQTGLLQREIVMTIMVQFRQYLEAKNLQQSYSVLMFYCNWSLHVSLDRGVVQDMLDRISNVVIDTADRNPVKTISEILSLRSLRLEIKEILQKEGIKVDLFESYKGWKGFVQLMVAGLLEKPLKRRRKPITAIYAEALELQMHDHANLPSDDPSRAIADGTILWHILLMPKGATLIGPLQLTESPKEFSKPD